MNKMEILDAIKNEKMIKGYKLSVLPDDFYAKAVKHINELKGQRWNISDVDSIEYSIRTDKIRTAIRVLHDLITKRTAKIVNLCFDGANRENVGVTLEEKEFYDEISKLIRNWREKYTAQIVTKKVLRSVIE